MTEFMASGKSSDYFILVHEAAKKALTDCKLDYSEIQQAVASYCYWDFCSGNAAIYRLALTGINIYNIKNNCSSGSATICFGRLKESWQAVFW